MYDLIVIGGGPGGYLAAERAGAEGKSVLLVEERRLGGVCLNEGCIPTKSLLNAMKIYTQAKESAALGVLASDVRFDLAAAMAWKRKTVDALVRGVEYQLKRSNVTVITGRGELVSPTSVAVGGQRYEAGNIVIATGSAAVRLRIPGAELPNVVTSTELLEVERLPSVLAVIGGGVVGMEFASLFAGLGVEVHVFEVLTTIVPLMDHEIGELLMKTIDSVHYHLATRVVAIEEGRVRYEANGEAGSLAADVVLMAVGRRPSVAELGLDAVGIDWTAAGIRVDERMRTNIPSIYAIGDVTGESLLAHSAYRMAEVAVNTILGRQDRMRYNAIPWVVYTLPEAAGCGLTEAEAARKGVAVKTARLRLRSNGRFVAEHGVDGEGLCKVVVGAEDDRLLGVHLVGGVSSEIIYGAAAMIESELRVREVREIVFPHPSVSETIRDALWELHA